MWHPHLVLGIEADIQGAGIDASSTYAGKAYSSELDYFGTVRGRIGYAFDRALVYGTGGFAYGGLKKSSNATGTVESFDSTATGWVVGGGLEYKITPVWSVKAEYQYIDLGSNDLTGFKGQKDDDYHTIRGGVNYHFGDTYAPLK